MKALILYLAFAGACVAQEKWPEIVSVQGRIDQVQAKQHPGNAWMKPCGPSNHDDWCVDMDMPHLSAAPPPAPPLPIVTLVKHTPKADTYRVRCKVPYQVGVYEIAEWLTSEQEAHGMRIGKWTALCWGPTKYNWSEIVTVPAKGAK